MDFETAKQEALEYGSRSRWDVVVYITKNGVYLWCTYEQYLNDIGIHPFQIAFESGLSDKENQKLFDCAQDWLYCQQMTNT